MKSIILVADLGEQSSHREQALHLFKALDESPFTKPYVLWTIPSRHTIDEMRLPSTKTLAHTRDAIILIMSKYEKYYHIDETNAVIYMPQNAFIDQSMALAMSRVNRIITPDYRTAYHIIASLRQLGLETPVHRLPGWFDINSVSLPERGDETTFGVYGEDRLMYPLVRTADLKVKACDTNLLGAGWEKVEEIDPVECDVYLHLKHAQPEKVQRAMAAGTVPITLNAAPYTEWILDGMNGFLCSSEEHMAEILAKLMDRDQLKIHQNLAYASMQHAMSAGAWVDLLLRIIESGEVENLNDSSLFQNSSPVARRWIIPRVMLDRGKEEYIPKNYDKQRFKVAALSDVEEILKFFAAQQFEEVYVFDWDYGDWADTERRKRLATIIRSMGRRIANIFWVSDREVPQEWAQLFRRMTKMDLRSGLNRIAP